MAMSNDEIKDAILLLRRRAMKMPAGHDEALWNLILDAERLLVEGQTIRTRETIVKEIERALEVK